MSPVPMEPAPFSVSTILNSLHNLGKGLHSCKRTVLLPARFALVAKDPSPIAGDKKTVSDLLQNFKCPENEKPPSFEKHEVSLRLLTEGYLFVHWQGLAEEEMAVFSFGKKGFVSETPWINCLGRGSFIEIPEEVKQFHALYLRIPQAADPEEEKARIHQILHNLNRDRDGLMQQVRLNAGVYALPMQKAADFVEEYKTKPGFMHSLSLSQADLFRHNPPPLDDFDLPEARFAGSYGAGDAEWLQDPKSLPEKNAWLIGLHDATGMAHDFSSLHAHNLEVFQHYHNWHSLPMMSGTMIEAHLEYLRPKTYISAPPTGNEKPLSQEERMALYGDHQKYKTVFPYFRAADFSAYRKNYEERTDAVRNWIADTFVGDWTLLLADQGKYSIARQLVGGKDSETYVYYDTDQQGINAESEALSLTDVREEIFQQVHACMAMDSASHGKICTLFDDPGYAEFCKKILAGGGLPGDSLSIWLMDFLPFLMALGNGRTGSANGPKPILLGAEEIFNAFLKRLGLEEAEEFTDPLALLQASIAVMTPAQSPVLEEDLQNKALRNVLGKIDAPLYRLNAFTENNLLEAEKRLGVASSALEKARKDLETAEQAFDDANKQRGKMKKELADLEAGKKQTRQELKEAKRKLPEAKRNLAEAEKKLAKTGEHVKQMRERLAEIKSGNWRNIREIGRKLEGGNSFLGGTGPGGSGRILKQGSAKEMKKLHAEFKRFDNDLKKLDAKYNKALFDRNLAKDARYKGMQLKEQKAVLHREIEALKKNIETHRRVNWKAAYQERLQVKIVDTEKAFFFMK